MLATVFYPFAILATLAAVMVVFAKNSVRAVLWLVLCFFATAVLWLLLEAEFLAITLVLVYVGAVMVLFLFVVMMLDVERAAVQAKFITYLPVGLLVAGSVIAGLIWALSSKSFSEYTIVPSMDMTVNNIKLLGELLYTKYLFEFEVAGILLLVAIVSAISLTFRGSQGSKKQQLSRQVSATKASRLKVLGDDEL